MKSNGISETSFHRVIVRFVGRSKGDLLVVVPGWDPECTVRLNADRLGSEVMEGFEGIRQFPVRVHARVNLGVEAADDLVFRDWETGKSQSVPGWRGRV